MLFPGMGGMGFLHAVRAAANSPKPGVVSGEKFHS